MESIDGKTSTEDDDVQDYHSVHKAQELIKGYLEDQLHMKITKLHEFTDGCAASTSLVTVLEIFRAVLLTLDSWCREVFLKPCILRGNRILPEPMSRRR